MCIGGVQPEVVLPGGFHAQAAAMRSAAARSCCSASNASSTIHGELQTFMHKPVSTNSSSMWRRYQVEPSNIRNRRIGLPLATVFTMVVW
jgi:hypothetical protein